MGYGAATRASIIPHMHGSLTLMKLLIVISRLYRIVENFGEWAKQQIGEKTLANK